MSVVVPAASAGGLRRRLRRQALRLIVSSKVEAKLKDTGLNYRVCDITDPAQIGHCVEDIVSEFGRVDVLFNVAGINFRHAAQTFRSRTWTRSSQ